MATATHPTRRSHSHPAAGARLEPAPPSSTTSAADLLEGVIYAISAFGVAFVAYLAPVPGLLPAVLLIGLAAAVVAIPLLVVGAAIGVVAGLLLLVARLVSRGISVAAGARTGPRDRSRTPGARGTWIGLRPRNAAESRS